MYASCVAVWRCGGVCLSLYSDDLPLASMCLLLQFAGDTSTSAAKDLVGATGTAIKHLLVHLLVAS